MIPSLKSILARILPTQIRTVVRGHQQQPARAHTLDVDALHAALRSAESGDCSLLFGIYRDIIAGHAHTQAEFSKRKLACLNEPLVLTAHDPDDAAAVALAADVQRHLADNPGFLDFLIHSLDSVLYPVAVSERTYRLSSKPGWRFEIAEFASVPHTHLAWPQGHFSLRQTDDFGHFTSEYLDLDPARHIVHRGHLLSSVPDWWGGPMRALLFWWLFATMDRDWWIRFLDRFGAPFLVGKYPEEDDRARWELQDAFSAATRLFGMAVTRGTEVEMHQANSLGGGEAFERFHTVANREISKLIVGQTSSSEIQKSGLGDSQGTAQSEVREDYRKWDAFRLGKTIRLHVLQPLWRANGWTIPLPTVSFGAVSEAEAELTGDLVASLATAGIQLSDDGLQKLSGRLGLGLERIPSLPPRSVALSAQVSPLLHTVARRAARQRQARRAVDEMVAASSPRLGRLMSARAAEIASVIEAADSPESAAAGVAALAAAFDPGEAAELVAAVLSSASANAVIALDD